MNISRDLYMFLFFFAKKKHWDAKLLRSPTSWVRNTLRLFLGINPKRVVYPFKRRGVWSRREKVGPLRWSPGYLLLFAIYIYIYRELCYLQFYGDFNKPWNMQNFRPISIVESHGKVLSVAQVRQIFCSVFSLGWFSPLRGPSNRHHQDF